MYDEMQMATRAAASNGGEGRPVSKARSMVVSWADTARRMTRQVKADVEKPRRQHGSVEEDH